MKIRKFYVLTDGVYKVTMYTEDWSQGDQDLIAEFGEPQVDLGGSFTHPAFTLPNNLVNIMTGSPFGQGFDSRDFANALTRANTWATTVSARIVSEVNTLRQNTDSFSKEVVQTV